MSDWKSRAKPVSDWKSRAQPASAATPDDTTEADFGAAEPAPTFGGMLDAVTDVVTTPAQVLTEAVKQPDKFAGRVRSAMDGATAGLYGKALSGLESVLPGKTYEGQKAENLPLVAKGVKDNPVTNLAGSLATPGFELPAASFVGRALVGGGNALAQTLARQYGHTGKEGLAAMDGISIPETAINTGLGAGLGTATGPWGRTADDMALRAAGMRGGITNKLQKAGYRTSEDARELGNAIRTNDLVPWFGGPPEVAANAKALKQTSGQRIGGALDEAQASGIPADFQSPAFAARRGLMQEPPVLHPAGDKLRSYLDLLEGTPQKLTDEGGLPRPATYQDLNDAKSAAWDAANFDTDAKGASRLYRQGNGRVAGDIQRQVEAAAGPEAANELAAGNRQYGVAADVEKIANEAATRDSARQSAVPAAIQTALTSAAGMGGMSHGGALEGGLAGLGTFAATHLAKTHGPAFMTRAAQAMEPLEGAVNFTPDTSGMADYIRRLNEEKDAQ